MKKSVLKIKLGNSIRATLMSGAVLLAAVPVTSSGISFEASAIEQEVLPEKYYKPSIRRCKKIYKESLKKAYDMYIKAIPTWIEYSDNLDKRGKCYVNAINEIAQKFVETLGKLRSYLDEEDNNYYKKENNEEYEYACKYGEKCSEIINEFKDFADKVLDVMEADCKNLGNHIDYGRAYPKWGKRSYPFEELMACPNFSSES